MPESLPESPLEQIAKVFVAHGVEFIVIGGQAEFAHGGYRATVDVDLCYRRTKENLERLAAALRELKPTLRNAPADLPFIIDARTLELGSNFTFTTAVVDLDLFGWVEPLGDYEVLSRSVESMTVGGIEMRMIGLDDLIKIKQHIGRAKDRESVMELLAIKKIRDEK